MTLPLAAVGTRRGWSRTEPASPALGAVEMTGPGPFPAIGLAGIGAMAAVAGLVWLSAVNRRQRLEFSQLERNFQVMTHREAEFARLARDLIAVQEQERRRMAQELHDSLGQKLLLIRQNALFAPRTARPLTETLSDIAQSTAAVIDEVRTIAYALRPQELERLGLVHAVESLAHEIAGAGGLDLHWSHTGGAARLTSEAEMGLFRVVQESLQNVLRHARARKLVVETASGTDCFTARIQDDGEGFDPGHDRSGRPGGLGLPGMRDRVRVLGGSIGIRSAPGAGTEIRIELPQPLPERYVSATDSGTPS